ncbi:hypothetical protein ACH5RR_029454 [Cinchona calisaya]|uniref:Zinc knuckle CX2CX4HX4C domain-containing protein n=1 Tax=Cinchona calisaya TaxID=153742 RepID=A0ABD2YSW4_9GENT
MDVILSQIRGKDGKFIKLLVEIDVTKSLLKGTMVRMDGDMKWVSFKNEKLPDFCYVCGIIGHSKNSFPNKGQGRKDKEEPQFSSWLKANVVASSIQLPKKIPQNKLRFIVLPMKELLMKFNSIWGMI